VALAVLLIHATGISIQATYRQFTIIQAFNSGNQITYTEATGIVFVTVGVGCGTYMAGGALPSVSARYACDDTRSIIIVHKQYTNCGNTNSSETSLKKNICVLLLSRALFICMSSQ
jgi:hypothetical protein